MKINLEDLNKKWLVVFVISVVVFLAVGFLTYRSLIGGEPLSLLSPWGGEVQKPEERIFDKYAFPYLAARNFEGSEIKLERVLKEGDGFTSWVFSFFSDGRKVTGYANLPNVSQACVGGNSVQRPTSPMEDRGSSPQLRGGETSGECKLPVVILVRGFVPEEIYQTGMGSQPMADYLAENGFVTLSPDFLGFGGSDASPAVGFLSPLADRFEKPVTVLNLLASIEALEQVDPEQVFFWAHSNGGQIALSVLEITKRPIPTVLWAPVTKPFPYNVLNFTDEVEDKGKYLRRLISEFEKDYDSDLYSIHKYFGDIRAPIQLHQGKTDVEVPVWWSDEFYGEMKGLGKEIEYFTYEETDHNMQGGWQQAAERSLGFFRKFLLEPRTP